VTSSALKHRKR